MSRKLKTSEKLIFPIIQPKKSIELESEGDSDNQEPNILESPQSNVKIKESIYENKFINDANVINKPYPQSTEQQVSERLFPNNTLLEDVTTEECIFRILSELSLNNELIDILSSSITEKLISQLNSKQIASFISQHTKHNIDTELLNYSVVLQEIVISAISNRTSKLLKNKTLEGGN